MDLNKIVKKRAELLKKSDTEVYYRSDTSKNFSVHKARVDLEKLILAEFKAKPTQILAYLPGVFATPSVEYARKILEDSLYSFEFTGKIFLIPNDLIKVKGNMRVSQFILWLKDNNYDAVLGLNSVAIPKDGYFNEIVILNQAKISDIKKMG